MAGVAVDDARETDAQGGQWRVLRFVEDSIQVGVCNGRQVTFGLREYGVEVIEQQRFVRDAAILSSRQKIMPLDAHGIGNAVIKVVKADHVDDIENIAVTEAVGAQ